MDGGFSLVVLESVPLDELGPAPTDMAAVVQGLLRVAKYLGQAEGVVLEAIPVDELGLLDAMLAFQGFALWAAPSSLSLYSLELGGVGGFFGGPGNLLSLSYSSSGGSLTSSMMYEMRRAQRSRRYRGSSRMCW